MRLWSLHPKYLDRAGLTALWREGLLAKKVLEGQTKGYKNHPQLIRFKGSKDILQGINMYLHAVCDEADSRGYSFDRTKLLQRTDCELIEVTSKQIDFEWKHLGKKLKVRAPESYKNWLKLSVVDAHPLFIVVSGDIEPWERL